MGSIRILCGSRRGARHYLAGEVVAIDDGITRGLAVELVAAGRAEWISGPSAPKPVEAQDAGPLETRGGDAAAPRRGRTGRPSVSKA